MSSITPPIIEVRWCSPCGSLVLSLWQQIFTYFLWNISASRRPRSKHKPVRVVLDSRTAIALEPDTEKREIKIPIPLQNALGKKFTRNLDFLSFTHKKEFIVWYSEAKKDETRAGRVEKMKQMLAADKVIS